MNDYIQLLNDPRWIIKRDRILKRDKHKCTVCNSKARLSVHHTYYYKRKVNPWEYPDSSLITLCDDCHYDYHIHHEIEYRDFPKKNKQTVKPIRKKKTKRVKHPKRIKHKGKICLAIIQANKDNYYRDEHGTWKKK